MARRRSAAKYVTRREAARGDERNGLRSGHRRRSGRREESIAGTGVLHAREGPMHTGFSLRRPVPVARVPQFYRPHLDLLPRSADLDPVTRIRNTSFAREPAITRKYPLTVFVHAADPRERNNRVHAGCPVSRTRETQPLGFQLYSSHLELCL